MSQQSADRQTLTDDQEPNQQKQNLVLLASNGHSWLTLIGTTFFVFELFFLQCYSDNFWFSLNLWALGIPAILSAALIAYLILRLAETERACRLVSWVWKGKPPVVYRKWLTLTGAGLAYGLRQVRFSAIDELDLTFWGNLRVMSRALCGPDAPQPDLALKFPFGIGSQQDQNRLVDAIKQARPDVKLNQRLLKRLNSPIVKGQNLIQVMGAAMMAVVLLDVGQSSTYYLEMLKYYYLARADAMAGKVDAARAELKQGDDLRDHPFPVSYVTPRFLKVGASAAGLLEARADALWAMGNKDEAIAAMRSACSLTPDAFRVYLHLARFLSEAGKHVEARVEISKAIDHHKDSLLPRLYMLASARESKQEQVKALYQQSLSDLQDRTFAEEPVWPPGGSRFVHDVFYQDDIEYVLDRLLGMKAGKS